MKYQMPNKHCVACGRLGAEGHHLKTRGSGGGDEEWNLMPLDRACHTEIHQKGTRLFAEKYPRVRAWLEQNEWELDPLRMKWVHA